MKERGLWTEGKRMVKEDTCRSRQAGREALPGSLEGLDSGVSVPMESGECWRGAWVQWEQRGVKGRA